MASFLASEFPEYTEAPAIEHGPHASLETARKTQFVWNTWLHFLAHYVDPQPEVPGLADVLGFMLYRVVKHIPDDSLAGAVSAATFMRGDLNCLFSAFRAQYGSRFTMTALEFKNDERVKRTMKRLRLDYGESYTTVHARPIWFQDEQRLLRASSSCTMGLMNRALLRVMTLTGGRGSDLREIRLATHVERRRYHDDSPALIILVPNVKTQRGDLIENWITGEAYLDVNRWVQRRETIFPRSRYLFITTHGKKISSSSIAERLADWSVAAGYPHRFFTCHSGRMAFGCRLAAHVMSQGGSDADIFHRASSTGLWAYGSSSVKRYCDTRVRRFFNENNTVTWEEFKAFSPVHLHGLNDINPIERLRPRWFQHDPALLQRVATWLEVQVHPTDQTETRFRIGNKLLERDRALQRWLEMNVEASDVNKVLRLVVGLLLEDNILVEDFQFSNMTREQLESLTFNISLNHLIRDRPEPTLRARQVRYVHIRDADHLEAVKTLYRKRKADRHVTLAVLPNDEIILINHRLLDRNTDEVLIHSQPSCPNRIHNPQNIIVPDATPLLVTEDDTVVLLSDDEDVEPPELDGWGILEQHGLIPIEVNGGSPNPRGQSEEVISLDTDSDSEMSEYRNWRLQEHPPVSPDDPTLYLDVESNGSVYESLSNYSFVTANSRNTESISSRTAHNCIYETPRRRSRVRPVETPSTQAPSTSRPSVVRRLDLEFQ